MLLSLKNRPWHDFLIIYSRNLFSLTLYSSMEIFFPLYLELHHTAILRVRATTLCRPKKCDPLPSVTMYKMERSSVRAQGEAGIGFRIVQTWKTITAEYFHILHLITLTLQQNLKASSTKYCTGQQLRVSDLIKNTEQQWRNRTKAAGWWRRQTCPPLSNHDTV